jgi:hypothetical protein
MKFAFSLIEEFSIHFKLKISDNHFFYLLTQNRGDTETQSGNNILYIKCVALARQNARSDRVCLDLFFGYFLLIK